MALCKTVVTLLISYFFVAGLNLHHLSFAGQGKTSSAQGEDKEAGVSQGARLSHLLYHKEEQETVNPIGLWQI